MSESNSRGTAAVHTLGETGLDEEGHEGDPSGTTPPQEQQRWNPSLERIDSSIDANIWGEPHPNAWLEISVCDTGNSSPVSPAFARHLTQFSPHLHAILTPFCDTGCGVSEKDKTRVFSPFVSNDNSTGLGLFVVQKQCEALGTPF